MRTDRGLILCSAVIFPLGVNLFSSHPTDGRRDGRTDGGREGGARTTLCKYGRRQSSSKLKNVGLHARRRADQWRVSFHEFNNLHPSKNKNPLSLRQISPPTQQSAFYPSLPSPTATDSLIWPPSLPLPKRSFHAFLRVAAPFPNSLQRTPINKIRSLPKPDEIPSGHRPNGPMSRRGHRAAEFSHKPVK